jgi:hypothetical protein
VIRFSICIRSALQLPPLLCALTSCTILVHASPHQLCTLPLVLLIAAAALHAGSVILFLGILTGYTWPAHCFDSSTRLGARGVISQQLAIRGYLYGSCSRGVHTSIGSGPRFYLDNQGMRRLLTLYYEPSATGRRDGFCNDGSGRPLRSIAGQSSLSNVQPQALSSCSSLSQPAAIWRQIGHRS